MDSSREEGGSPDLEREATPSPIPHAGILGKPEIGRNGHQPMSADAANSRCGRWAWFATRGSSPDQTAVEHGMRVRALGALPHGEPGFLTRIGRERLREDS